MNIILDKSCFHSVIIIKQTSYTSIFHFYKNLTFFDQRARKICTVIHSHRDMKAGIALTLLLCEFCLHMEAFSWRSSASQNKTCRLGVMNPFSNFVELPTFTCFVDKTLLIEEFFKNSGVRQFHVITAPPKFGKTTNLDMIKRFLQVREYREYDGQLFNVSSYNLKITPLIHSGNGLLKHHFQKQKCIYISFRNIAGKTWYNVLRESLSTTYKQFEEALNLMTSSEWYETGDAMMNPDFPLGEDEAVEGLSKLLSKIVKFWGRNITILIDDYDDSIRNAIEYNLNVTLIHGCMQRIFSSLFRTYHPNLRYAVITGTLNVLEQVQFGHMRHSNFLDNHAFTKYFGLTTSEVDHLLNSHSTESTSASLTKEYYGPYYTRHSVTKIYNPYSIIKYLACRDSNNPDATFENYWPENTGNRISNFLKTITNSATYREITSLLLTREKITFKLISYWSVGDLEELRKITHDKPTKLTVRRVSLILSYLFYHGYLSHGDEPETYRIPSEEIRTYLKQCSMSNNSDESLDVGQLKSMLSPPA